MHFSTRRVVRGTIDRSRASGAASRRITRFLEVGGRQVLGRGGLDSALGRC